MSINTDKLNEYLLQYYRSYLSYCDELDFSHIDMNFSLEIGRRASSLKKILLDSYEEGYVEDTDYVVKPLNAIERLNKIIHYTPLSRELHKEKILNYCTKSLN
ncbi:MAG: hypothetical protein AAF518_20715 [Spirochaetota bacterium]